jgi:hypothetical protein
VVVIGTALPIGIFEVINCPTNPLDALLADVVPIIPPVVGEKAILVAVAAPNVGVIKVGEVDPTKLPVPVCPDSDVLTLLLVAIHILP